MSTSKLICISVTRDGATSKIHCTKEVADMLMFKEIDTFYFVDFVYFFYPIQLKFFVHYF